MPPNCSFRSEQDSLRRSRYVAESGEIRLISRRTQNLVLPRCKHDDVNALSFEKLFTLFGVLASGVVFAMILFTLEKANLAGHKIEETEFHAEDFSEKIVEKMGQISEQRDIVEYIKTYKTIYEMLKDLE